MTQTEHPQTGHMRVQLSKRGKIKTFVVYRLVLEVLGEKPKPDGHDIKHLDGKRSNNLLGNLEWVLAKKTNAGVNHRKATLNEEDIQEIKMLVTADVPYDQIAAKMQVSKGYVSKIASGKSR